MESTQFERLYLKYTLENPDYLHKIKVDFFRIKEYQRIFSIVKKFFERFNKIPSKKQFEHLLVEKKLTDKVSTEAVDSIFDVDINEYEFAVNPNINDVPAYESVQDNNISILQDLENRYSCLLNNS